MRRRFATGLTETLAVVHPDQQSLLIGLWEAAAQQLGHRATVVRWWQTHRLPEREQLLGLDMRLVWGELHAQLPASVPGSDWPEPWGLQAVLTWSDLPWSPLWHWELTLRRFRAGSRWEAGYRLQGVPSGEALRQLDRARRLLDLEGLRRVRPSDGQASGHEVFAQAQAEARARQEAEALARRLTREGTPAAYPPGPGRRPQWRPLAALAQPGLWTYYHDRWNMTAEIHHPRGPHPGTIVLEWPEGTRASLWEVDPAGRIDRFNPDWRYWHRVLETILTPALEACRHSRPLSLPPDSLPDAPRKA